jgi:hypothetical protein
MSFQDIKIDNWIKNNQETLLADGYTFETFTSELHKHFLNPHWESTIVRTVVNSQMTATESFSTFTNRIMQGNNLLMGTTSRLDSAALCSKLEINMSGYLADKIARLRPADKQHITDIAIFEDWLAEISTLDDEMTADLKRITDFATEHIVKKQRTDNSSKGFQQNMYQSNNSSLVTLPYLAQMQLLPHISTPTLPPIFEGVSVALYTHVLSLGNVLAALSFSLKNMSSSKSMTDAESAAAFMLAIKCTIAPMISQTPTRTRL